MSVLKVISSFDKTDEFIFECLRIGYQWLVGFQLKEELGEEATVKLSHLQLHFGMG